MKKDSTLYTIVVAVTLCLVCSIIVSFAAVKLKPLQVANKDEDRKRNILLVAKLIPTEEEREEMEEAGKEVPEINVEDAFKQVEVAIVNLETGEYAENFDVDTYDQRKAAKDPDMSIKLSRDQDVANIKRRAKYGSVYLVKDDNGAVKTIVLPVHGYGLWSTLYGFLALEGDANTVVGLSFYSHAETPGLGGEVDNPNWKAKWPGKKVLNGQKVALSVTKNASGDHQIDALSGATLTSQGVSNLVQFWLGKDAFGPYLNRVRSGR